MLAYTHDTSCEPTGHRPSATHTTPRAGPPEASTMNHAQLSDVQIANLTLLLTIRDGVMQDRLATCCKFALDAAQAERLGTCLLYTSPSPRDS